MSTRAGHSRLRCIGELGVGLTVGLLVVAACRGPAGRPAVAAPLPSLPLDRPLDGRLQPRPDGEAATAAYGIRLAAGWYLRLSVEQQGVDLVATFAGPSGPPLLTVDSPTGAHGKEELEVVARQGGVHRLELRPFTAEAAGDYRVRVGALRRATEADRRRAAAAAAFAAGDALRGAPEDPQKSAERRALAAYRRAAALWRHLGDGRREALATRRIGQVLADLGETRRAAATLDHALALYRRLGEAADEARVANDAGNAHRRLGRPDAAAERFTRALKLARAGGHRLIEATARNNLALLDESEGRVEAALASYEAALEVWEELDDRPRQAATLHNLGACYSLMGRLPEAADLLRRARRLRAAAGDARGEAATLTALGWIHYLEGRTTPALACYRRALTLRRRSGDARGEAATLDRYATLLRALGRHRESLAAYRRALAVFQEAGEELSAAHVLANLGELHLARRDAPRARHHLAAALPLLRRAGDRHGESHALVLAARVERLADRPEAARRPLEEALALVEELRAAAASPALRAGYLASRHEYYGELVDLLMELEERSPGAGHAAAAFTAAERARARSLLDVLAAEPATEAPAPPGVAGQLRSLEARLAALAAPASRLAAGRGGDGDLPGAAWEEVRRLLLERERLRTTLPGGRRPAAEPLALAEVQSLLGAADLLLAYSLGESRSFLWVVSAGSLASHELPPRSEIEAQARGLHALLSASRRPGPRRRAELAAAELSRMILAPAARDLAGLHPRPGRLVVVPDGALHYVPFAALPAPAVAGRPPGPPLVTAWEIVQEPSASVPAIVRRRAAGRPRAAGAVAVMADPVFGPPDPRLPGAAAGAAPVPADLERSARDIGIDAFPRLPFTHREALAVARLAPPGQRHLTATGFAADRRAVLAGGLAGYRIVHLATHGLVNPRHPELSGLVLSLVDPDGRPRDGFLRAHEIARLDLPADLVVLSACRTALGRELRGEGLLGLTHGLLDAGATRVVVSLWGVDDEGTAELMERFYRGVLVDELAPARALRQAQLELLGEERWASPYHWAGFVLQGDWEPVGLNNRAGARVREE